MKTKLNLTVMAVAEVLKSEFPKVNKWTWHPKQTSHRDFADLTGYVNDEIFLQAKVTTSSKPVGTINIRMRNTLRRLNSKKGKKFYFVKTDEMLKRAKSKIAKNNWNIEPIKL